MLAGFLIHLAVQTGAWTQALFALASGDPYDSEGVARQQSRFKVLCEVGSFHAESCRSPDLIYCNFLSLGTLRW
jgi:hypothetical protein